MSDLIIPIMILLVLVFGLVRRIPVFDTFVVGAKSGLDTAISILPTLVAMLVFIAMLVSSGALGALTRLLSPALRFAGIPEGALAVMIVRPFSGSAALAMLEQTFATYGVDSMEARAASAMMGSSETIFYTLPLYLAAAKVKRSRYAVPAALVAWLAGCVFAAWACALFQ